MLYPNCDNVSFRENGVIVDAFSPQRRGVGDTCESCGQSLSGATFLFLGKVEIMQKLMSDASIVVMRISNMVMVKMIN
ncbi:hypothetical protein COD66_27010 [Bacillus cereus]|nr:hypothetical protein COD66_27010 [Bacillus cereus]